MLYTRRHASLCVVTPRYASLRLVVSCHCVPTNPPTWYTILILLRTAPSLVNRTRSSEPLTLVVPVRWATTTIPTTTNTTTTTPSPRRSHTISDWSLHWNLRYAQISAAGYNMTQLAEGGATVVNLHQVSLHLLTGACFGGLDCALLRPTHACMLCGLNILKTLQNTQNALKC